MLINPLMHCGSAHNANRRSEWPLRESHIHSQALLLAVSVLVIYRFLCEKHFQCGVAKLCALIIFIPHGYL